MAVTYPPPRNAAAAPSVALARFEDVVALAGHHRDIQMKLALERDVRLVRFEQGQIEFSVMPGGSPQLAQTLDAPLAGMDRQPLDGGGLKRARCTEPQGAGGRQGALGFIRRARRTFGRKACSLLFRAPRSSRSRAAASATVAGDDMMKSLLTTASLWKTSFEQASFACSQFVASKGKQQCPTSWV